MSASLLNANAVALGPRLPVTIMARRIDVPCVALGFTPPPCPVHIKFLRLPSGWALIGLTPPAKPSAAARWLETYGPVTIQIAPGLSPKVLRATFAQIPSEWEAFLSAVVVHYLELTPEGSASLFVEDSSEKVERFIAKTIASESTTRSRKTLGGRGPVRLTARQLEILSLAVALGYYEIPHRLNLRTLAKKVGLSVGAVSELLRRGEALIVSHYVDALSAAEWESSDEGPAVVASRGIQS